MCLGYRSSDNWSKLAIRQYLTAKLKGVLDDTSVSLHALAGIVLGKSFIVPQFSPYPWAAAVSSGHTEFLFSEMDCMWQIFISLRHRDSLGLPLLPIQASTDGQLVTLMQSCKPIAEGSIIGHHPGYLDAIMDTAGSTKRLTVSLTRSLIVIDKVRIVLCPLGSFTVPFFPPFFSPFFFPFLYSFGFLPDFFSLFNSVM